MSSIAGMRARGDQDGDRCARAVVAFWHESSPRPFLSMSALLDFDLRDGGSVVVEVEDTGGPVMCGGRPSEMVTKAGETLEDVLGRVGPAVHGIMTQLRETAEWPGEVEVEFAIKLSADAGVIIARSGGEANFKISLRWASAPGP